MGEARKRGILKNLWGQIMNARRRHAHLWCLPVIFLISGCADPFAEAKDALRRDLKDPDATQFRDVRWCGKPGGAITGDYNAKNSYGAYTGFRPFFYSDHTAARDFEDVGYEHAYRQCMKEMAALTAERSGKPFNEAAEDARLNSVLTPDDLTLSADEMGAITENISASTGGKATPVRALKLAAEEDHEVPVCDRPNSPEKFALMNEIGVGCSGE